MASMSSEDEDMEYESDTPKEVNKSDNTTYTTVLPHASKAKYDKVYDDFQKWNTLMGATPVSQNVMMKYFSELADEKKPTTLWTYYSMLKATLRLNDNIDISSYSKLFEFLKTKNVGYKPRKAIFTEKDIEKFFNTAPDEKWLDVKVGCIFALNGVKSSEKLVNVKMENVKQYDDLILVTIPKTGTRPKRSFTITGTFLSIVRKYLALRPEHEKQNHFFLQYREGKCTTQSIGRSKFCEMPRKIAKYLKLPKPDLYTANSFRIASANTGAFNPPSVSEKQHVEYSLDYETGLLKPSLINYTSRTVSTASNENDNMNGNKTGHVCTVSCGQVKCAIEGNEESVLHAFTIMKPSNYTVTEVTPAVFNSYPFCRWLVGYTHITEPVSSFNAYETFEDLTESVPNNVKVVQKYIRGNSSQMVPAYVVEYGVNCRCRKQSSDMFSCSVNEIKSESRSLREQVCSYIL